MAYIGGDFDPMDVTENNVFVIDFVNYIPSGSSITQATITMGLKSGTDPNPSSHLYGSPSISDGTRVSQGAQNLLNGNIYTFEVVGVTSQGNAVSLWSHIPCENIV